MPGPFDNISPLPAEMRRGLTAMASIGLVSLTASTLLFLHITYKLVQWKIRDVGARHRRALEAEAPQRRGASIDLNMGLAEDHYYRTKGKPTTTASPASSSFHQPAALPRTETPAPSNSRDEQPSPCPCPCPPCPSRTSPAPSTRREKPPNPLLLLIYSLILADGVLSVAYLTNISWLSMDGMWAPSPMCSLQGFIVGFGCLTTSGFLFAISVLSYLGIIRGYKATTRDVCIACCAVWSCSILLASLGPMYYHDQSLYGRETMWCWISEKRKLWRLSIYIWGFSAMGATIILYSTIFYKLWREGRSSRFMPRRRRGSNTTQLSAGRGDNNNNNNNNNTSSSSALRPSGHHPAFLIYPCIYAFTGTPLILGSLIPALERNIYFMATAGSLFAMTGLLDTVLWSSIILFSRGEDLANTGLDQFSFVRTPEGRTLGNIVFVQGGGPGSSDPGCDRRITRQSWQSKKQKGWWRLREGTSSPVSLPSSRSWPSDQESRNYGIQMEVVTSVVVEDEGATRNMSRQRETSMDSFN